MEDNLIIPKAKEEWAKDEAQRNGGRLLWDPAGKWVYLGKLPPSLSPYREKSQESAAPWVLDIPFALRSVASKEGVKWNEEFQVSVFNGNLPSHLRAYLPERFSWEEHIARKLGRMPEEFKPRGGIKLHQHQETAVSMIKVAIRQNFPGFLLADEVGLGKTYSAWAGLLGAYPKGQKVLVVAPIAVLPVWRDVILTLGSGGYDIILINYDRLKRLFAQEEGKKKAKSLKGWAKSAKPAEFDNIIWDESHYLKTMHGPEPSARAKLASKLYPSTQFMLWLSATAGQTPIELGYVSPLIGHITKDKIVSSATYEEWCKKHGFSVSHGLYGKWEWKPESPEAEEEQAAKLHKMLFKGGIPIGLRRRPQDVAGWPEMQRIPYPVVLNQEQRKLYQVEWAEFCKVMELERKAGNKTSPKGLAALMRLRQKASLLKIDQTVEYILELLENKRAVAVSVEFRDSIAAIEKKLKGHRIECAIIHGNTPDREQQRLDFQTGKKPVILFSVKEGISLHQGQVLGKKDKPRAQVVHDLRWSGIDQSQIDGRCHRNGEFCPIYWMIAQNTVEDRVSQRMLRRLTTMASTLGDEKSMLDEIRNTVGSEA